MSQGTLLAVHLAIFLTLLAFCALLALPVKMLFHMKLEHKDKTLTNAITEPSPNPEIIDIDYRSLKKCPHEYKNLLQSAHRDYYDENCQKPKPESVEIQNDKPHIRVVKKVVMRKVYEPRKKGARCSSARSEKQKGPEGDLAENTFPYVSELILKMVLVGLMISAVVERINYYLTKNMVSVINRLFLYHSNISIFIQID